MSRETVYFYGHTKGPYACFSQFYPCSFVDEDGAAYGWAEQFMMAGKARVMGDDATLASIMAARDPTSVKALGRRVTPYDDDAWAAARYEIVVRANLLKFGQNKRLRAALLATGDATLAEAAANDRIWGIGLSVKHALQGGKWNGQNLLGKALMAVRAELRGQPASVDERRPASVDASDATPPPPPVRRKVSDEGRETSGASLASPAGGARARRAPRVQHADLGIDREGAALPEPRAAPSSPRAAPRRAPGVDYYLVLDFEATCDDRDAAWVHEIIEFPAVLVCARTLARVDEFRALVRPVERPALTPFCTRLTSLAQADVDGAAPLADALARFGEWLGAHGLRDERASAVLPVTCGDWDLRTQLPRECARKRLGPVPALLRRWCNVKTAFAAAGLPGHRKAPGMAGMLAALGLPLVGHHHLGIDDSRNIASIVGELARRGVLIEQTGTA